MKIKGIVVFLCGLALFPAAFTTPAQTKVSCNFSTYLNDPDTDPENGTNIRAEPRKNSKIVRTIGGKSGVKISDEAGGLIAEITGFENGWFEVSSVSEVGGAEDKMLFEGRGWIHSSIVGMDVAAPDPRLYAAPQKKSRVLMRLKPDESRIKLLACEGEWVKVSTGGRIGWLSPEGQCGNPLTTCP